MALTETKVKQLKPTARTFFVADEQGLSLKIDTNGQKTWTYRYTDLLTKKRHRKNLGRYPELTLKLARQARDEYQEKLLKQPIEDEQTTLLFAQVAREWLQFKRQSLVNHAPRCGVNALAQTAMDKDILPAIGQMPFEQVKRFDLVYLIRKIEQRGVKEPVLKACSYLKQLYDYAMAMGYCEVNLANQLHKILMQPKPKKHYPYLTQEQIPEFLQRLKASKAHPIVKKALLLKLYTGVRGAELLSAQAEHFDLNAKIWKVPAIYVKQLRRKVILGLTVADYDIPLSDQAIEIIQSAMQWSAGESYIFSSPRNSNTPLHFNTLNSLIRRLGYSKTQLSSHGLRASMSTILNESGRFHASWIEAQLSHVDKNLTRASYNHAQYLPQRAEMMQWWADLIDQTQPQ